MTDLLTLLTPPCAGCAMLDAKPIESGLRYCHGAKTWQRSTDRIDRCSYRTPAPTAMKRQDETVGTRETVHNPEHRRG